MEDRLQLLGQLDQTGDLWLARVTLNSLNQFDDVLKGKNEVFVFMNWSDFVREKKN